MNDSNKDVKITSENEDISNIDKGLLNKNRLLSRVILGLVVVVSIIASIMIFNNNVNVSEAGVAIGGSNTISTKNVGKSSGLNHYGLEYPILYITLDDTGEGIPAGFDYEDAKAKYNLSKILINDSNSYGGYLPSQQDSSLVFIPYEANDYLARLGYTTGRNRDSIRSTAYMAWSKGPGSEEIYKEHGSSKPMIKTINSANVTPSESKSALGIKFTNGIYYTEIKNLDKEGKLATKWASLISNGDVTNSLHLWNYFTDFSGQSFDVTTKVNQYLHSTVATDDIDRGYRYLDLLMTGYSMAKGSSAANNWKTTINNYINNNDLARNGAPKGANIIIHSGVIYNKNRDIYLMSHMDAINFTMGMTSNGNMANKPIGAIIQKLALSRSAGLETISNTYQFNLRLREAYGKSYTASKNATRTAWSGADTYFGSTLTNYILEKRPEEKNWKKFKAVGKNYIKSLYLPVTGASGTTHDAAYGLNVVLANAWSAEPTLALTGEVKWTDNGTHSLEIADTTQANINDSVTFNLNLSTTNISAWKALAEKYKKSAVLISVTRKTVGQRNIDATKTLSPISPLKLGRYNTDGDLKDCAEYTFYEYGTANELIELLEKSDLTLNMFTDESTLNQVIAEGEAQAYGYDIGIKIELYNGDLAAPSSKYIYGQSDTNPDGVYRNYKYSELTTQAKKGKMRVKVSKGCPPTPDGEAYEYVQYISEPEAYAELKEGTVNIGGTGSVENFEAMAGVPSTETLYFTSGGSEFIAEIYMQKIEDEESERQYTSWYNANTEGSEFMKGDTLKGGTGTYSHTETFVANADGVDQNKSVTAESSKIVTPSGNSSGNITIGGHNSSSTIWSQWTGTIGNSTPEPSDIGSFDPGKPGSPCPGQGYDVGEQRTKAEPSTNWSVSSYNTALNQAITWATGMEGTNSDYTVQRISDSDGQKREWIVGDAVIQVTMTGGSNGHSHTSLPGFGKNRVYTSSSASGAEVASDESSVLGNGWGWSNGKFATGSYSGCCQHGAGPHKEWDVAPKAAVSPDADGNGGSPAVPGVPHSYTHSDSFTSGVDLTQSASATINYTIKVTFKNSKTEAGGSFDGDRVLSGATHTSNGVLAAHALCGPDCQHDTLPAVYDKWSQKLKYDYMRINAVSVFKISRSYVSGMEVITYNEDENVSADVTRGDPNIFYNIAEENANYSSDNAKSPSLAGRIRYSLQSQQHDIVTWRETSTDGDKRTNKSDGTTSTVAGNAVPSGGTGHSNQNWANGMLYNNNVAFTTDEEWFKTITTATDKTGYSSNVIDKVDEKTEEYIRFNERRTTDNTAVIVSDMLILQTSTGDQSVMYFTKEQKVTAQEHYGEEKELDASVSEMWNNNGLSAANWGAKRINVGGYTGNYATPKNKFSSGAGTIPTVLDANGGAYDVTINHTDPKATVAGPLTYSTVANAVNTLDAASYKSSPAKLQKRMSKVLLLKMVKDGVVQNPINPNKEYITGDAKQFYIELLSYKRAAFEDANLAGYEFEYLVEPDDVLGIDGYGEEAVYSPNHTKINDIVVHDPVSVQNATIVPLDAERDQRTELSLSASENLMDEINGLDYCPGTPELCEYRYLNCKYYQDSTLLSLNFNPKSTIVTMGTDGSAPTKEIETVKTVTDDEGNTVTSVVDTVNQLEYDLPDGFTIDKTNRFGTGDSLMAYGDRLSIPLSDLGLGYKASNRIQVEMNFYMPEDQADGTMIVSFYGYDFYIPVASNGLATWNTGHAWEKNINGINFAGTPMKLKFVFSMSDIEANEVYVNGTKVTDYTRVAASSKIDSGIVGDYINIGSWNASNSYPAKFYIDNLVITKLAGTHEHDASCYTEVYNHQKFTKYTCQVPVEFSYTGGSQTFTAPVSGYYKLEAWGASGGGSEKKVLSSHAGYGGYSTGRVYLQKGETIAVNVGGQGQYSNGLGTGGGYNGGGHGGPAGYGGGGATDLTAINSIIGKATSTSIGKFYDEAINHARVYVVKLSTGEDAITINKGANREASTLHNVFTAGHVYKVYFDAWSTVAGDVVHVDAHPDNLPEKSYVLTQRRTNYSFDLTSNLSDMNGAALRFFDSGEVTDGTIYITNIKVYDLTNTKGLSYGDGSNAGGGVVASLDTFTNNGQLTGSGNLASGYSDNGENKILAYNGDTLTVEKVWPDGWLATTASNPLVGVDTKNVDTIEVRLKNNTGGTFSQIHYRINGTTHFEGQCINITSSDIVDTSSNGFVTYRVPIKAENVDWGSGKIEYLRLDLCNGGASAKSDGTYVLDYIKFIDSSSSKKLTIAGGGGGSDNSGDTAATGTGDDGSGGDGGGLIGGNASVSGKVVANTYNSILSDIPGLMLKQFDGSTWARVLYQDISANTNYFTTANMLNVNKSGMFSAVGRLAELKTGAKFEFMLNYPDVVEYSGMYNRWKQTNNPLNEGTNAGTSTVDAIGYEPIHIDMPSYGGNGLERNGSHAVLDGIVNYGNWWLAVGIMNGSYTLTNTVAKPYTMPGPCGGAAGSLGASEVELWVRVDGLTNGGGSGVGGTQTYGYALGQGESVAVATDSGGAGGGYYGGYVTNHSNGGGAGGSSYIGGVLSGTTVSGVNYGSGKARITLEEHTHNSSCKTEITDYNKHVHDAGCIHEGSTELINALQKAQDGNDTLLKSLLGTTVYNKLKTPPSVIYTWDNWSTADMKQFVEYNALKLSASSNNLIQSDIGWDSMFGVGTNIKSGSVSTVRVRAKITGNSTPISQLFWSNENYTHSVNTTVVTNISTNGAWQTIDFNVASNPNWSGNISSLRFDMIGNSSAGGQVEIDYIQLIGNGAASAGTGTKVLSTYSGFKTNDNQYGITNIQATNTFSSGNIVSTGNLGWWEFKLPVNIANTDALQAVRVTMINQTNVGAMGVRNSESAVEYWANMVANSTATQVITIDTRGMTGPTSSLWFDTAGGNATGTTKVSKIELIGYGNQTVAPTDTYTSGAYNAHIHTQNCRYVSGAWTTCNGALNTYSDLVNNTPVTHETGTGNQAFEYTGASQTFTAPVSGNYTLKTWGASAGGWGQHGNTPGGYAEGTVYLAAGQRIYVTAGGKGIDKDLYNDGTGYNGGGRSSHGGGGGATHIATATGILSSLTNNRSSVLIVAGGGGSNGYWGGGGQGGGLTGGNSWGRNANNIVNTGGTQTTGGSYGYLGTFGQGGNGSGYGGSGGGGWFGGAGVGGDPCGGGGSSYLGGVLNGSTQTGIHTGNGKAVISWNNLYYTGPNYVAPANRYNYTNTPATIVYAAPSVVSSTASYGFAYLDGTYSGILRTVIEIAKEFDNVPQTIGGKINPIFACQNVPNTHVCTDVCKTPITKLTCTEPHHTGSHYDGSNPICWDACDNDENHKSHPTEVDTEYGGTLKSATFINTDYAFQVYFPNTGDFYQTDWTGIASTVSSRGIGYVENMNTTKWTREKRIMFSYDVLFFNEGTWEQYLAGDWIELPVTGDTYPYYDFYCTLNNYERASADVYYQVEAINCDPSPGGKASIYDRDTDINNDNFVEVTNKERFSNLTSYHGAFKSTYIDLVGRIGNLLVSDTDDMRFSNFFKAIKSDKWLINGIINEVYEGEQARYLSWHKNTGELATDIRGMQVDKATGMYNTWGTQVWTSAEGVEAVDLPLSAEKNNIVQLREDPLKPGYDVLFEISTMGNYQDVGLQILPYFYALNTGTGELVPVDVWMTIGEEYKAINIHKLSDYEYYWDILGNNNTVAMEAITDKNWVAYKNSGLFDYVLNLDWLGEQERRNYDSEEQLITTRVSLEYTTQVATGDETVTKLLEVPIGSNYALGTLQLLNPSGKARTFIGSNNTNTVNLNGGTDTNIGGLIEELEYNYMAQRWHLKLGLPSSAVFTKYINEKHLHPTDLVDKDGEKIPASEELSEDEWAILMTADIKSIGSTWVLQYDQGVDNGTVDINGKIFALPGSIPTVLAVYDSTVTSTSDVESIGTH